VENTHGKKKKSSFFIHNILDGNGRSLTAYKEMAQTHREREREFQVEQQSKIYTPTFLHLALYYSAIRFCVCVSM